MNKILWIDTETTGLNPAKHGLRELAYILVIDGQVVEKDVLQIDTRTYKTFVEIDDKALELSNVTIEDFDNFDDSAYAFDKFSTLLEYVDKEDKNDYFTLAGFNVKFDNDFLREWFYDNDAGAEFKNCFHYKVIDVFPLVITLKHLGLIDTENDKLKTVCEYFDIPIDAHNALSDIEATKNLYELISDRFINDKEVFKQKEFEYRTNCQNLVSAGRVEADNMPDRLAELEKVILDYYLAKGYQIGVGGWAFNVVIRTWHKNKRLLVYFRKASWDAGSICFSSNKQETTKEMFDKAIEYFSIRQSEVIECNQTKS